MRQWFLKLLCIVSMVLCVSQASAQLNFQSSPYIYRLKIDGCRFEPKQRAQTGFRIEGEVGIATALHGVADCTTINAAPDDGKSFNNLSIRRVDIKRDMAFVSSSELDSLPSIGLQPVESAQ